MMCVASLENNFPEIRSHPHIHMGIGYNRLMQRWVPNQYWVILSLSSRFYTSTEKWKTSLLLSLQKSRACKLRSYWGTPSATWMEEQTTAEKKTDANTRSTGKSLHSVARGQPCTSPRRPCRQGLHGHSRTWVLAECPGISSSVREDQPPVKELLRLFLPSSCGRLPQGHFS